MERVFFAARSVSATVNKMDLNDPATILTVWNKGTAVPGYDPALWRQDACRAWMRFDGYGNRASVFGWEIDHIIPDTKGGSDDLNNLQPLHWENNTAKGDGPLRCVITSHGNSNVTIQV